MRQYDKATKELLTVICNQCEKELEVDNGILKEGYFEGRAEFGYFSNKDGQVHHFDLCEACYDAWISGFKLPITEKEVLELL